MKVQIKGLKINYIVRGKGEPVVILHGWGADLTTMANVIEVFSQCNTVYAIDLPGFGLSESPDKPWDVYDYEDLVTKFIKFFELDNVTLVGHSFGGSIALCISYARSINLKAIYLIDSAGIRKVTDTKKILKVTAFKTLKLLARLLPIRNRKKEKIINRLRRRFGSSDYYNTSGVMKGTFIKVVNSDLTYVLSKVLVPTVLIWGENDTATPLSDAQLMNGFINNSRLKIIKNAGHFPFIDQKNEFQKVLCNEILRSR